MNKKEKRIKFREGVLNRDGNRCRVCKRNDVKLDAHHITDRNEFENGGYVLENGITLCDYDGGCHMKAEKFHMSNGRESVLGYTPDDLYLLIGSNLKKALEKDKNNN